MLFICFLFVVILLFLFQTNLIKESKSLSILTIKQKYNLKNGDLVFVSYNNVLGTLNKVWSGSKWTHIGIVYNDPLTNESSVLEVAEYNNPNFKKGVTEIPLNAWFKLNEDFEIGYAKLIYEIEPHILYELYEKYKDKKLYKLNYDPRSLSRFVFPTKEKDEQLTCVEFITLLFQELNLLDENSIGNITTASDIIKLPFVQVVQM
jgi:hypothetical protein